MTHRKSNRKFARPIAAEPMERRLLMSTYTVNTLSDAAAPVAGQLTLRQAVADANSNPGPDTIAFDPTVFTSASLHTITLLNGPISFTDTAGATTLDGPGPAVLSISGNNASRIFQISSGATVSIGGLAITGGKVSSASEESAIGGGVENAGVLTLTNVNVSGNGVTAGDGGTAQGGAVYSSGSLSVINSTISGNTAQGGDDVSAQLAAALQGGDSAGGGIWNSGSLNVSNSVVSGNTAAGGGGPRYMFSGLGGYAEGGGIYTSGSFTLNSTMVSNNTAHGGPDSEGGASAGGGIYTVGQADLVDSICSGNQALGGGGCSDDGGSGGNASGGAVFSDATVTINSTTFTSNKAYGGYSPIQDNGPAGNAYGGAITALGSITLTGSMLDENQAIGGGGNGNSDAQLPDANGSGGGIYATATLVVAECTVSGNSAQGGGGAIYGADGGIGQGGGITATGNASISASSLTGNSAIGGSGAEQGAESGNHGNGGEGEGGGAFSSGTLTVIDSTISGNQSDGGAGQYDDPDEGFTYAGSGGAAIGGGLASVGELNLSNSTIANNDASGGVGANDQGNALSGADGGIAQGGGIFSAISSTLTDVTVVGNSAVGGAGGSAWPDGSPPTPGATGSAQGGGVYAGNGTILDNSIVSDNNGASGADVYSSLSAGSGFNLIGYGGGLINGANGNLIGIHDPMLAGLAENGGPTLTMLPLAGSPVIEAGSVALVPGGTTTDQRGAGFPRVLNGAVDIGAVEYVQGQVSNPAPVITVAPAADQAATAGQSVSFSLGSFSESNATGPFTVMVDWGDGSANSTVAMPSAGKIPALAHDYLGAGTDMVSLTVTDPAGDNSASSGFKVTVAAVPPTVSASPSTTTLTATTLQAPAGTRIKLIAAVDGASGTSPTGEVTFSLNGSVIGTATLRSGEASFETSALAVGNDVFTASYGGDGANAAGTSAPVSLTIASRSTVAVAFSKPVFASTVVAGAKFNARLPLTLTNTDSTTRGMFRIKYYVNRTPALDDAQVLLITVARSVALKAGRHLVLNGVLKFLPATLPAGAYYLIAEVVDPSGLISVAATSSTVMVTAPFVRLSATIGAVNPTAISTRRAGFLNVTITNTGNVAAIGVLRITVNPSSDGTTQLPESLVTFHGRTVIPAGRHIVRRLRLKVPVSLAAGTYFPSVSISLNGQSFTSIGPVEFLVC